MFENYLGQKHLVAEGKPIYNLLKNNNICSMVLYGPPGIGKTKLANIIKDNLPSFQTVQLNAASSSLKDFTSATANTSLNNKIIIIVDEIHRLDKTKQNFLLEKLEKEMIYIIGTTTENPYISLNNAMRSRLIIFELFSLSKDDIIEGLVNIDNSFDNSVYEAIYLASNGDVRMSQNIFNFLLKNYENQKIDSKLISELFNNNIEFNYKQDEYYDLLSALQKSIRGSDLDGALHYLARLILIGDFDSLIRRLTVIAYEDISLASPNTCMRVNLALQSFKNIGMPEGRIILANVVCELALAPKSPSAYQALDQAISDVEKGNYGDIPPYIKYNSINNEEFKYDRNKVDYMDTLPSKLQKKMYLQNYHASKSEEQFYDNYTKRNNLKKQNRSYND